MYTEHIIKQMLFTFLVSLVSKNCFLLFIGISAFDYLSEKLLYALLLMGNTSTVNFPFFFIHSLNLCAYNRNSLFMFFKLVRDYFFYTKKKKNWKNIFFLIKELKKRVNKIFHNKNFLEFISLEFFSFLIHWLEYTVSFKLK